MPISDATYERVALEDPEGKWELEHGCLRQKPGMTIEHNRVARELGFRLRLQLDRNDFDVVVDQARVRRSPGNFFIPDVFVVPMTIVRRHLEQRRGRLEAYAEPLPFVVEVWSRSTGRYDLHSKVAEYQRRGDAEIWFIHPYHRTVTAWRRQPDGSYTEMVYQGGTVRPVALPNVEIDLDTLFD